MESAGFDELADLALRRSGQAFRPAQAYLVEARLAHILRRESFSTLQELASCLQARPNAALEQEIAAALTGKETRFFGDRAMLVRVATELLPAAALNKADGERVRILCAGGATGQEAFSLAILLAEGGADALHGRRAEIISIDHCKASTTRARAGSFSHFEIQTGLSVQRMLAHFTRHDGSWRASEALRSQVTFRVHNLLEDLSGLGVFDVVLCRSVLPAMAGPIAADVVKRLGGLLAPEGLLFLSEGEALPPGPHGLVPSYAARGAFEREKPRQASAAVA